jgi:hypothetical protein
VKRMLSLPRTVLHELDPSRIIRTVLLCRIVALGALRALKRNDGS